METQIRESIHAEMAELQEGVGKLSSLIQPNGSMDMPPSLALPMGSLIEQVKIKHIENIQKTSRIEYGLSLKDHIALGVFGAGSLFLIGLIINDYTRRGPNYKKSSLGDIIFFTIAGLLVNFIFAVPLITLMISASFGWEAIDLTYWQRLITISISYFAPYLSVILIGSLVGWYRRRGNRRSEIEEEKALEQKLYDLDHNPLVQIQEVRRYLREEIALLNRRLNDIGGKFKTAIQQPRLDATSDLKELESSLADLREAPEEQFLDKTALIRDYEEDIAIRKRFLTEPEDWEIELKNSYERIEQQLAQFRDDVDNMQSIENRYMNEEQYRAKRRALRIRFDTKKQESDYRYHLQALMNELARDASSMQQALADFQGQLQINGPKINLLNTEN